MKRETKYPYIMVDAEGTVQNIAMIDDYASANTITQACYGEGACAYAYQYAVSVGDRCVDGTFYVVDEKGVLTEAEYIPSDEDQISVLNDQLMDAYLALTEQYETSLDLQEQVTNTMMALTELYESM